MRWRELKEHVTVSRHVRCGWREGVPGNDILASDHENGVEVIKV